VLLAEAEGAAFITTLVDAVAVQFAALVTVMVYVPPIIAVAPVIEGLCVALVKLFGPLQLYVFPAAPPVKAIVVPGQYGPALLAVAVGFAFTTTFVEAVAVHVAALVTVTVYTPAIVVVAFVSEGF